MSSLMPRAWAIPPEAASSSVPVIQAKDFQIEIRDAYLEGDGRDLLVAAPTSSGKGYVIKLVADARPGEIFIVIEPLKVLMVELSDKYGKGATYINSDNISKQLLDEILAGTYQLIFISPEMARSQRLQQTIWSQPGFANKIGGIIVDETHTVVEMGLSGFRKDYSMIGTLRHFNIPILAMTGTLPPPYIPLIVKALEMRNPRVLNYGADRPNVTFNVWPMQYGIKSNLDILTVLPELNAALNDPDRVPCDPLPIPLDPTRPIRPRTSAFARAHPPLLIYQATRAKNTDLARYLECLYEAVGERGAVETYSAGMSESHKKVMKERIACGDVLVCVCTDALGMGSDMPVTRVIQWRVEGSLSGIWQRWGRAGRDFSELADVHLFVEAKLFPLVLQEALQAEKGLRKARRKRVQDEEKEEVARQKAMKKAREQHRETGAADVSPLPDAQSATSDSAVPPRAPTASSSSHSSHFSPPPRAPPLAASVPSDSSSSSAASDCADSDVLSASSGKAGSASAGSDSSQPIADAVGSTAGEASGGAGAGAGDKSSGDQPVGSKGGKKSRRTKKKAPPPRFTDELLTLVQYLLTPSSMPRCVRKAFLKGLGGYPDVPCDPLTLFSSRSPIDPERKIVCCNGCEHIPRVKLSSLVLSLAGFCVKVPTVTQKGIPHINALRKLMESELAAWADETWKARWQFENGAGYLGPDGFVGPATIKCLQGAANELVAETGDLAVVIRRVTKIRQMESVIFGLRTEVARIIALWRSQLEEARRKKKADKATAAAAGRTTGAAGTSEKNKGIKAPAKCSRCKAHAANHPQDVLVPGHTYVSSHCPNRGVCDCFDPANKKSFRHVCIKYRATGNNV